MLEFKRILLAEDDPHDIELTLGALSDNHLANGVDVVRDGVEALEYIFRRGNFASRTSGDPAVVLLDIKMPRVDGLEVLRRIREEPNLRYLPVVILTSSREEGDLLRSYQLGVNGYVVKPVDFEAFASALRQVGMYWAVINEPPPVAVVAPAGR